MDLDFSTIAIFVTGLGGFFAVLLGCFGLARSASRDSVYQNGPELPMITKEAQDILDGAHKKPLAEVKEAAESPKRRSRLAALLNSRTKK